MPSKRRYPIWTKISTACSASPRASVRRPKRRRMMARFTRLSAGQMRKALSRESTRDPLRIPSRGIGGVAEARRGAAMHRS